MRGVKVKLTREQKRWLKENFATTKNDEICEHLGITGSVVHRYARQMRLKKDKATVRRWWDENREIAHQVGRDTGFAAQARSARQQWKEWAKSGDTRPYGCFQKGKSNKTRMSEEKFKETIRKATEVREAKRARDKRRVALGLEPLTGLVKAVMMSRQEIQHRHTMKMAGYQVFRGDPVIYYDDKTKRSAKREATAAKIGLQVVHISRRVTN